MGYAPRKTMNGYSFDEATSAMQKAIRRGDERVALFFSAELDRSGFGEYVWKRLRIICSEDIGLAEPMMPAVIRALYESWRDQFKKRETRPAERMFLIHAVLLLVRARKSRIVDHAKMVAYLSDELIEVPEYALDKHTLRGKRAGRGWDHFFAEAIRLDGTTRVDLATGLGANTAVHMEVGPDDAVYYTTFGGGGEVRKLAPPATPPPGGTWLSDIAPLSATNGYGPYERDMSNGGPAAGDGGPIRLDGVTAAKGLGVHAASTLTYPVGGATTFTADVGVDDECGASGTVVFQVLVGGVVKFDSGVMSGASPTRTVTVGLAGATQVVLRVTNGGDGSGCDHADWANARLLATAPTTTSPPVSTSPPTTPPASTVPPTTPPTTVPPAGTFVSGMTPRSATNGYGPYERNTSNGGPAAGDGSPIRLNGVGAAKGLGVHAASTIVYRVPTGATAFRADVGVDDECGAGGSVVFQVLVNGVKKYDSAVMRATTATKAVVVPVAAGNSVSLRVTNAGDGSGCDHADWANARFT